MKISDNIIKKIVLEEQSIYLSDILLRRTGLGWRTDQGKSATYKVATLMSELKGWDKKRKEEEIRAFYCYMKEMQQVQ